MCLAIPGVIEKIEDGEATIDFGGLKKKAELLLVPDAIVGDRVMVHAGFIIAKVDEKTGDELIKWNLEVYTNH